MANMVRLAFALGLAGFLAVFLLKTLPLLAG